MGQVIKSAGGGVPLKYNLFVQPEEPAIKDGLWIQAPEKGFKDVIIKDSFMRAGFFAADADCEFAPSLDNLMPPAGASGFATYNLAIWAQCVNNAVYYIYEFANSSYSDWAGVALYKQEIGKDRNQITGPIWYMNMVTYTNTRPTKYCVLVKDNVIYVDAYNTNTGTYICKARYNIYTESAITNGEEMYFPYKTIPFGAIGDSMYYIAPTSSSGWDANFMRANLATQTSEKVGSISDYNGFSEGYDLNSVLGDKVYMFIRQGGVWCFNATTGTKTILNGAEPWLSGSGGMYPMKSVIQGHNIFMFSSDDLKMYSYNIDTNTYTAWDNLTGRGLYGVSGSPSGRNNLIEIPGHGLLVASTMHYNSTNPSPVVTRPMFQFVQTSEAQKSGSLCILTGSKHPFKILNIQALLTCLHKYTNAPVQSDMYHAEDDFSLHDAWYYDTDFREYPTYIGNGSTWTKIKN